VLDDPQDAVEGLPEDGIIYSRERLPVANIVDSQRFLQLL